MKDKVKSRPTWLEVLYMLILALAIVVAGQIANAATLNKDDYIESIKKNHSGYKASQEISKGAEERIKEANIDTMISPRLFMEAQWATDESQKSNPGFQGIKSTNHSYLLGVEANSIIGLAGRLYYEYDFYEIQGAAPTAVPLPTYHVGKPTLELSQSLWKNFFGRETRALLEASESKNKATHYSEQFVSKAILAEAEATYWRLALARENLKIQKDSLERSKRLRDWNRSRVNRQLADRSDALQAEAGYTTRELEYHMAQQELLAAARAFNSLRGIDSDEVSETLEKFPSQILKNYKIPQKTDMRDDVKAALEAAKAAKAAAKASREKTKPTFEVYGAIAYGALDEDRQKAFDNSWKSDYPTKAIGVRFNMPLDIGLLSDVNSGYKREEYASELRYQRKLFEQELEWKELVRRVEDAQKRLQIAEELEKIQKSKYDREGQRLRLGRTTTFLLIQFEQEYALSQLNKISIQTELLSLIAQIKLYGETL